MPTIMVRNVSPAAHTTIAALAKAAGMPREAWLRALLEELVAPVPTQSWALVRLAHTVTCAWSGEQLHAGAQAYQEVRPNGTLGRICSCASVDTVHNASADERAHARSERR